MRGLPAPGGPRVAAGLPSDLSTCGSLGLPVAQMDRVRAWKDAVGVRLWKNTSWRMRLWPPPTAWDPTTEYQTMGLRK